MEHISIYLHEEDKSLKSLLEERATRNNRSLSAEIVVLVKTALANERNFTFWDDDELDEYNTIAGGTNEV